MPDRARLPADRARRLPDRAHDAGARIDPLEELRELEGIARRQALRGGMFGTDELMRIGSGPGAGSLGHDRWPGIEIDLGHPSPARIPRERAAALVAGGCAADVVVPPAPA